MVGFRKPDELRLFMRFLAMFHVFVSVFDFNELIPFPVDMQNRNMMKPLEVFVDLHTKEFFIEVKAGDLPIDRHDIIFCLFIELTCL